MKRIVPLFLIFALVSLYGCGSSSISKDDTKSPKELEEAAIAIAERSITALTSVSDTYEIENFENESATSTGEEAEGGGATLYRVNVTAQIYDASDGSTEPVDFEYIVAVQPNGSGWKVEQVSP